MRGFDIEESADQRADHGPLIQPETIHHHQHDPAMHIENGPEEFGADIHREWRPVAVALVQPVCVVSLQITCEVLPQTLLKRPERVLEPGLFCKLHNQLHPLTPCKRGSPPSLQLPEARGEVT
jgi:hypothetical protein